MSSVASGLVAAGDSPASRSARSDSGLFVTVASLVRPLPRNIPTTHEGDDDRGDPGSDRPPRVRRGCAGEALGHATVLTKRRPAAGW